MRPCYFLRDLPERYAWPRSEEQQRAYPRFVAWTTCRRPHTVRLCFSKVLLA